MVERKVYDQHTVSRTELEDALLDDSPLFFRAKEERYLALAKKQRHLPSFLPSIMELQLSSLPILPRIGR